jgi:hypothetical protein
MTAREVRQELLNILQHLEHHDEVKVNATIIITQWEEVGDGSGNRKVGEVLKITEADYNPWWAMTR